MADKAFNPFRFIVKHFMPNKQLSGSALCFTLFTVIDSVYAGRLVSTVKCIHAIPFSYPFANAGNTCRSPDIIFSAAANALSETGWLRSCKITSTERSWLAVRTVGL